MSPRAKKATLPDVLDRLASVRVHVERDALAADVDAGGRHDDARLERLLAVRARDAHPVRPLHDLPDGH